MRNLFRHFTRTALIIVLVGAVGYMFVTYYPYIFAKNVDGVIANVEKISPSVALVGGGMSEASNRELFSFAIGIRTASGEIVTGSSEDRQWAVAKTGLCAEAKFYPYPFWQFDKAGTYFGARLLKLYECATGTAPVATPAPQPSAEATPQNLNTQAEDAAAAAAASGAIQESVKNNAAAKAKH